MEFRVWGLGLRVQGVGFTEEGMMECGDEGGG